MSLPEQIRVYVLQFPNGAVLAVVHEAARAVRIRNEWAAAGIQVDIVDQVSSRGPHAGGEIEFRCYPCPSHHTISVEAVEGLSEVHDGCCDAAARQRDYLDLVGRRVLGIGLCDHDDFEEIDIHHGEDDVPVSFNPFSGGIRSKTVHFEIVTERCRACGLVRTVDRDCDCER